MRIRTADELFTNMMPDVFKIILSRITAQATPPISAIVPIITCIELISPNVYYFLKEKQTEINKESIYLTEGRKLLSNIKVICEVDLTISNIEYKGIVIRVS